MPSLMPILFLGHGSPMNAISENEFVAGFRSVSQTIPKPKAILCISAHWETRGTLLTAMEHPVTIHDFGGFPKELFDVQYPAPGSPELAHEIKSLIEAPRIELDLKWGLDHGTWSVLKHFYPKADIPIVQMSLNYYQTAQYHYEILKDIAILRQQGILIVGSGNLIHNLSMIDWENFDKDNYAFEWAQEAETKIKNYILNGDHKQLINYRCHGKAFELAIPTPEHYLPLLYVLSLMKPDESLTFFNEKSVGGSLSMTSIKIG